MEKEKKSFGEKWNAWWHKNGDLVGDIWITTALLGASWFIVYILGVATGQQGIEKSMAEVDPEAFTALMAKLGTKDAEDVIKLISEK